MALAAVFQAATARCSASSGNIGSPCRHVGLSRQRPVFGCSARRRGLRLQSSSPGSAWQATAGDDGGGGSIGGGGSSNSGGDGGGEGEGEEPVAKGPLGPWKGWQDRVAMDPQFPYKVLVEQVIGVGASVVGDMSSRPNWGLSELDFVFSTLIVGSIVNFSLMYFLAPTAAAAGVAARLSPIQYFFSEAPLVALGAPTSHLFMPGFSLGARLLNFGYKGLVFAVVGLGAGLVGTATSNGLLLLRKKLDPEFKMQNEAPSVLGNAATWAAHMGISSNLRYQSLNGIDMVLQPLVPTAVFRIWSVGIRALNNVLGGMSFVTLAKMFGVQKAADAPTVA